MYAFQPRRNVRQAQQPVVFAPELFFEPVQAPQRAYHARSAPAYTYEDAYSYDEVEEPTELDMLEYEEQQLLEQQAQIVAQRKRLAARKQHLQREQAFDQERLRQLQAQRYLEEQRRQQIAHQQRAEEARRQQLRQRQLASLKEAQLEAALRDLERSYDPHSRVAPSCAQQCRAKQQKVEPSSAASTPIEFLLRTLLQPTATTSTRTRRAEPATQTTPTTSAQTAKKFAPAHAQASSSSPAKPATAKPTSAPTKPAAPVNPLSTLKARVEELGQHVVNLLSTQFDSLTLRQFGKVDNDLMQALLALDNVEIANEATRAEKKALVNQTVSLLEQVDQYKDAYSRSSSESSSQQSSSDAIEALQEVTEDAQVASSEDTLVEPSFDQPIDSTASSSNAQDTSFPAESYEAAQSSTDVEQHDDADVEPSDQGFQPQEEEANDDGEWDDDWQGDEAEVAEEEINADDEAEINADLPVAEDVSPVSAPAEPEADPFGFNQILSAVNNAQSAESSSSVPIQIGNARKASVVIESAQ